MAIKIKSKKAQQETVGFVIIILLIMIIGTIFLGIWLRANKNPGVYTESSEINNFLGASLSQTTDCYKDSLSDLKSLGKLIEYCYRNQEIYCPNDEKACDYINRTYASMLTRFRPAGLLSYYKLNVYFKEFVENNSQSSSEEDTEGPELTPPSFIQVQYGTTAGCSTKRAGRTSINTEGGDFMVNFETCDAKL